MAAETQRTCGGNTRRRRLTRTCAGATRNGRARGLIQRLLLVCVCVLPLLPAQRVAPAHAQSGRIKKEDKTSTTPAKKRRAASASPAAPAHAPDSSSPETIKTNDAPPPAPTPTPRMADEPPAKSTSPVISPTATSAPSPTPARREQSSGPSVAAAQEVGEDEVVRIASNLVPIPATVVDAGGFPVLDLELKDFELQVDGEARPLGDLHRSDMPVVMAMLFDNSSSLNAAREFEKRAATQFFRKVLRPHDRAAIYSVSTIPTLARPLTSDVRALVRTIESFEKPEGATALLDAVERAAEYLRPQVGRRVIVIVSDGVDTISDASFEDVLARAVRAHCQIYIVQTGHSDNVNLLDLTARRRMHDFAAQTGGAVYSPLSNADLNAAFSQIAADLAQQYVLSYYATEERRDGRFHAVTLRITTRPALRVRTRKGYYSPKG